LITFDDGNSPLHISMRDQKQAVCHHDG